MIETLDFDVIIKNKNVVVSNLNVAEKFRRRPADVLRRIDNIQKDWDKLSEELNAKVRSVDDELALEIKSVKFEECFFETSYLTEDGRTVRSIDMNRMGFTILVTGFNGKDALRFKIAYFSKFDEMEKELTARNTLYELEKMLRKQLTDTLNGFYEGERLKRQITKYTNLLYISVVGNAAVKIKRDRGYTGDVSVFADILTSEERSKYIAKENELISLFLSGHDDYYEIKDILLKEEELAK